MFLFTFCVCQLMLINGSNRSPLFRGTGVMGLTYSIVNFVRESEGVGWFLSTSVIDSRSKVRSLSHKGKARTVRHSVSKQCYIF